MGYYWSLITNGVIIQWGTGFGNSTIKYPISYNEFSIVTASVVDTDDAEICGVSIDWTSNTDFFCRIALERTFYNYKFYWISLGI